MFNLSSNPQNRIGNIKVQTIRVNKSWLFLISNNTISQNIKTILHSCNSNLKEYYNFKSNILSKEEKSRSEVLANTDLQKQQKENLEAVEKLLKEKKRELLDFCQNKKTSKILTYMDSYKDKEFLNLQIAEIVWNRKLKSPFPLWRTGVKSPQNSISVLCAKLRHFQT